MTQPSTQSLKAKSIWGRVAATCSHCVWLGTLMGIGHALLVATAMAFMGEGGPWSGILFVLLVAGMLGAMTGCGVAVFVAPLVWDREFQKVLVRLGVGAGTGSVLGLAVLLMLGGQLIGSTTDELLGLLGFWGLPVAGFVGGAIWCRVRLPSSWRRWSIWCCQSCGYDRRGIAIRARCPECGAASTLAAMASAQGDAGASPSPPAGETPAGETHAGDTPGGDES
jgi:hypothetical protein